MRISVAIFLLFVMADCRAQKTFRLDSPYIAIVKTKPYKVVVVSKDDANHFTSKPIANSDRYTPSETEAIAVDNAIQWQWADAVLRQTDKQNGKMPAHADSTQWNKNVENYQRLRAGIIKQQQKDQRKKIQHFDRYLWGYLNADGEKLIIIKFDPHKIRHYSISGETFVDVLYLMVYNINRNILSVAGWSDHKE